MTPTATFGSLATTPADTLERCCTPSGNNSDLTFRAPGTSARTSAFVGRGIQSPLPTLVCAARAASRSVMSFSTESNSRILAPTLPLCMYAIIRLHSMHVDDIQRPEERGLACRLHRSKAASVTSDLQSEARRGRIPRDGQWPASLNRPPMNHAIADSGISLVRLERIAGWDLHPLESAALSRRTPNSDIDCQICCVAQRGVSPPQCDRVQSSD